MKAFLNYNVCCVVLSIIHLTSAQQTQGHSQNLNGLTRCPLPAQKKDSTSLSQSVCPQNKATSALSELETLFEDYWQWMLRESPESATSLGIHKYDDRLTNNSFEAIELNKKKSQEFLQKAKILQPCITNPGDSLSLKILIHQLEASLEAHDHKSYYFAINDIWGIENYLPLTFDRMPIKSIEDYNKIISRLEKIPTAIDQIIALLKAGVNAGITHHYSAVKRSNETIGKRVVKDHTKSVFYKYFVKDFPTSFSKEDISSLKQRAALVIKDQIVPSFEKLRKYVVEKYIPSTRNNVGISSLPNGPAMYQRLIREQASVNYTAQQIHDIGLCEIQRIRNEMEKVATELGYSDLKTLNEHLKTDPNNFYSTSEELVKGYEDIIKRVDVKLPKYFKSFSKVPVIVVADSSPGATVAYYKSASLDGSNPGEFVVGTHNLKGNPKNNMVTLTLHEASPGHHMQISTAMELPNIPIFRRAGIGGKYNAYIEGWALYAESLGLEMGLFGDPLQRYGHYSFEIWRACRLVVDTGMHALGWTREKAINTMAENIPIDLKSIEREIDRYIAWPGQANGYKIGELVISNLRKKATEKLKNKFDLKAFHDVILSLGALPLELVEDAVDLYIMNTINNNNQ